MSEESVHCLRTGAMGTMDFLTGAARKKKLGYFFPPNSSSKFRFRVETEEYKFLRGALRCVLVIHFLNCEIVRSSRLPATLSANKQTPRERFPHL